MFVSSGLRLVRTWTRTKSLEYNTPNREALPSSTADVQTVIAGASRLSAEDHEKSQRDFDAALQLLVNRAQYITGATGAAIALRLDGSKDMLCRASIGPNAPELGALLSTEFGLSGESVRTKRALRCDDAGQDVRVNREICRQLGIASVIVMPVLDDDQVHGVFELFSEKANAFSDRDLSVVHRLSEMVETAIRLAQTQSIPVPKKAKAAAVGLGNPGVQQTRVASPASAISSSSISSPSVPVTIPAKKALLWSAPEETEQEPSSSSPTDQSLIPPVLRDLRKCVACGFPISAGRSLCVECEEKKWRGQLRRPGAGSSASNK